LPLEPLARRHCGQSDTKQAAIRDVMRGLRRAKGVAQCHVEARTTPLVRRVLATCASDQLLNVSDRVLLLVDFAGALRRSELVALAVADVAVAPEGLRLTIRRSQPGGRARRPGRA
jgi:integrase